jgi:predicted transcriptional regulator
MDKINLSKRGMSSFMSALESDILEYLWTNKQGNSKLIHDTVRRKHDCAHSSIAVMLDRMHKKGLLTRKVERCRGGERFIYYPKVSKQELGDKISEKFLRFLKTTFGEACVANLRTKIK